MPELRQDSQSCLLWYKFTNTISRVACSVRGPAESMEPEQKKARFSRASTDPLLSLEEEVAEEPSHSPADVSFTWPSLLGTKLSDHLVAARGVQSQLHHILRPSQEVIVTTSYTGLGTVEHALVRMATSVIGQDQEHGVVLYAAWESNPKVRALLAASKHSPMHIFGDVTEKIAPEGRAELHRVLSVCLQRGHRLVGQEEEKVLLDDLNERCFKKLVARCKAHIRDHGLAKEAWCYLHCRMCSVVPARTSPSALRLEAGGNTCVSWSPQGSRARWLHESSVPAVVWLCASEAEPVDVLVQECSHQFPTEKAFQAIFAAEKWDVEVMQLCCVDVAVPMNRPRNYSYTIRRKVLQRLCRVELSDIRAVFGQLAVGDGHSWFAAPEAVVLCFLRALSVQSGQVVEEANLLKDPSLCLPAGTKKRLEAYLSLLQESESSTLPILDLSQNARVRSTLSARMPTFLRHSFVWSCQHNRPLAPEEAFAFMGFPMPWSRCCSSECPWKSEALQALKSADSIAMIGNAMHVRVLGAFLSACLASTQLVTQDA